MIVYRIPSHIIHTRTPHGSVVLDPETKAYFELNGAGDLLWRTLSTTPRGRDALVEALCSEFDVSPEVANLDVEGWLVELMSLRLLEVAD